mgnify:CR=1 FL=1
MIQTTNLDFGKVLEFLKEGYKLSRSGWNGKGMYIYLVPANSYPAQTEVAKVEFGALVPYNQYIAFKSVDNIIESGWRPTTLDMFATDWNVI